VTIASDGWSDAQKGPLINFMAISESGPMFLKSCIWWCKRQRFYY